MEPLGLGVDIAGDGVGAQHMGGKGIELRRRVAEEVRKGDGREWMRVGVRGRVCENHCHRLGRDLVRARKDKSQVQ